MKNIKIIFALVFTGIFSSAMASSDTVKIKTSAQCEDCKERIENKLNFTKGIKNAVLDIKTKEVTVVYDLQKINPDKIRTAISKVGYDADGVTADPKAYNKLPMCCRKGGHD
ncbi:MAG: heavy-metal-associated domain-containing protein [Bacteroidetes bacterium]|nr:MAG: heavy-metal-associated domain-containing protein [Bacteroidota bacterium]